MISKGEAMTNAIDIFKDAFTELLGNEGPLTTIAGAFKQMEIAEEEISAMKKGYPGRADLMDAAFAILFSPIMVGVPDALYRVHARQLLQVLIDGDPIDRLTKAETAVVISSGSMHTGPPPDSLSMLALSSKEVCDVIGGSDIYVDIDPAAYEHFWPLMEQWCKKIYADFGFDLRSKTLKESLNRREGAR